MSTTTEKDRSKLPVNLVVNGKKVEAKPGQTVLDVVREQNLDDIPTLCHDPKLEPYGSCFLCVVEVKGAPRLLPACVTRIRDGMEVTTRNDRILHARRTALELLLSDHFADCVCPGQFACPAGVDIQGYVSLARLGYYNEALSLIRERNPLPVVCGRVCVRKCEVKCRRNDVDEPVGINFVKRYLAENASAVNKPKATKPSGKRVAIVGGGPAGLTCANYLAPKGHEVTLFEMLPKLGGMLRYGIPSYRLPRAELDEEIGRITGLGVKVLLGKRLGKDFTVESLLKKDKFDAVFLAMGAPLGKKMGVKGEDDVEGLRPALDFLRDTELHGPAKLSGKIAVVGGGNSAIDAARTALRCGADEVTILYRRTRKEMPAHHDEVDAAEKEGVKLELLVAPLEVVSSNGRLKALRCQRMELGEPDASGRRKPIPIKGSEFDYACDYLFAAIGQDTDLDMLKKEPDGVRPGLSKGATLEFDPATMATKIPGVFSGGDVVTGPAVVIDAIAHGRIAAESIDGYLRTGKVEKPKPVFVSRRDVFGTLPDWIFEGVEKTPRNVMPEREPHERARDFEQVELGLAEPQIRNEAVRCMECGCKSVFGCDLKRYAAEYGIDLTRFAGEVRRHRVDTSHPLITLDPNKCILCGRCIRTCADIVGLAVFGFVGRGFATVVRPALGRPLTESACISCGACVESCPTGALEAKLPYGRQGPWKARKVPSVCSFCSVGCELDINVVSDGLLWASTPETFIPGRGELCLKGRFGTGLIQGPERIKRPLVKKNGNLVETDWDEAVDAAVRVLTQCRKAHGPESLAVTASPRMTLEECDIVRHLGETALGTHAIGSFGQNRRGGPRRDLDDILGETASTCFQEDLHTADLILLAGADPSTTHPVLAMTVRRAARRGSEIAAINSSNIDLIRSGDLWLDARRGTGGIILAGVLKRIIESGRADVRGLGKDELSALQVSVRNAVIDEVSNLSGVDAAKIEALAEKLGNAKKVVAVYDLDDTLERSADDLRALAQLLLLTGHLGKPGEGLLLLRSDSNSEGARLVGIANRLDLGTIRGALVILENPFGDFHAVREMRKASPLVVVDHVLTETARLAEVVLPAATLAESEGTLLSFDRKIRKLDRASRPVSGLGTGAVLARLAKALGHPVFSEDPTRIRAEIAKRLGIPAADIERARNEGAAWPGKGTEAAHLRPLRLDSGAPVANLFPYATLDAYLDRKLSDLGLPRV